MKVSNKSVLILLAKQGGAPPCKKLTKGNACLFCNANTTWSCKSIRYIVLKWLYRFSSRIQDKALQEKEIPRVKDSVKRHQTVTWCDCSGLVCYTRAFHVSQIRLFIPRYCCVLTSASACSEKSVSLVHMMNSIYYGLRSICASSHVTNFSLLSVPVITGEVSVSCTDTNSRFRAEYVESTNRESPLFSQLHEYWLEALIEKWFQK